MSRSAADSFPATRSSLLSRVRHPSDADSWREFHAQYQRLVFQVCLKAGLSKQDAEDVAQEAMTAVAQAMPAFQLDRGKGEFRGWLRRITSNKVNDFLRLRYREGAVRAELPPGWEDRAVEETDIIDRAWTSEWEGYLLARALERVRDKVSARSMQIFHLSAVKQWSVEQIRDNLGLGRTQVYLARYRVGLLVKREIAKLRQELE